MQLYIDSRKSHELSLLLNFKTYVMQSVLFVCTGNYYRSRCAEILFNHLARLGDMAAMAQSRGFRLNPEKNKGLISPHAETFLTAMNIPFHPSHPRKLEEKDLLNADKVILLDEQEHRHMMKQHFPEWENKVEYWQLADDYVVSPSVVLPKLRSEVERLISSMAKKD